MKWLELNSEDSVEMIICGNCAEELLADTAAGKLTGDEAVTKDMLHELLDADTEPYQCEICLKQNEAYDEEYE